MKSRHQLMNNGLYPETLPPCFTSTDSRRAFYGLIGKLDERKFRERRTSYLRYNSTKHDGSRRFFATPNIVSYFHISTFIWKRWKKFEENFLLSEFSSGRPQVLSENSDRAIKVPSLSELSRLTSKKIKYSPFILKADIAQCFPSIYTHSIPWAAHGIAESKADANKSSRTIYFNELDFFVRSAQQGNTRGVLVGPDAYRIIAEFVMCRIDHDLSQMVGERIVGAVRHVDDYYIGLRSEHDAYSVLSRLREILAKYELNLNDSKTKIISSMEPINDLWAQRLRSHMHFPQQPYFLDLDDVNPNGYGVAAIERATSEAVEAAKIIESDSPIKILLRSFDQEEIYKSKSWEYVEEILQRIVQKYPHAIDYACLLVVKRKAIGLSVDDSGWLAVGEQIIGSALALNHHHEVVWLTWLLLILRVEMPSRLIEKLSSCGNAHVTSLVVKAFADGRIARKPGIRLGGSLATDNEDWLLNLVGKANEYSGARFSGLYAEEFQHLADRSINLIDFDAHIIKVAQNEQQAISRTRYGYDDDEEDDDEDEEYSKISNVTELLRQGIEF